jgi:hypothetical protein
VSETNTTKQNKVCNAQGSIPFIEGIIQPLVIHKKTHTQPNTSLENGGY